MIRDLIREREEENWTSSVKEPIAQQTDIGMLPIERKMDMNEQDRNTQRRPMREKVCCIMYFFVVC